MNQMMQNVAESTVRLAGTYERIVAARREKIETAQSLRWAGWIKRIADGDMDALAALYDDSSNPVFGLVHFILQDWEVAEETLIEIYLRVRQEARTFGNHNENASVWLITLARNAAVDRLRLISEGTPEFAQRREQSEQHLIIQMTYLGGFRLDEIANILGQSVENVRRQVVTAMNELRDAVLPTPAALASVVSRRCEPVP